MPTGLSSNNGFIGSGDLLVKDLADATGGYRPVGNASLFQLTPKVEQLERKSFQRASRGQTLDTVKRLDGVDIRIEVDTFGRDNLALALAGAAADFSQSEVTAQSVTISLPHSQWMELGAYNVSGVTIADKTEGVDFLVKPEAGLIMALPDGSIADGDASEVTFNAAAIAAGEGYGIDGGVKADILLALRLDGYDDVSGLSMITDVWRVRVSPTEAFGFITPEFNKLVLTGTAETPDDKASPFRTRILPAMS